MRYEFKYKQRHKSGLMWLKKHTTIEVVDIQLGMSADEIQQKAIELFHDNMRRIGVSISEYFILEVLKS